MMQEISHPESLVRNLQLAQTRFLTLLHKLLPMLTSAPEVLAGSKWRVLEFSLLSQMDAEERLVLPSLTLTDPRNARAMAREHELLRTRLREVREAFEDGVATSMQFSLLASELRAHALHEHELLTRLVG